MSSASYVLPLCLALFACFAHQAPTWAQPSNLTVRIGTYDNRAIAIAWAASEFNSMQDKMKAYQDAKQRGDKAQMAELEKWGATRQRQLHFQGFGQVPVSDLLHPVRHGLQTLLTTHNLSVITMQTDARAKNVEAIDITDELVKLYHPSEKTLKSVQQVRTVKPVPLTELADLSADE